MELWQIAKPFGRPAKFKSPQELWEAFLAYTEWSANNPMTVNDTRSQRKSTLKDERSQYKQQVERPLTLMAFCLHAGIKRQWADFRKDYAKRSKAFCEVLYAIENTIRGQQVSNALVGNYKENLVARLNGISDTVEQKVSGNISARKGMSITEAKQILGEIEQEI